MGRLTYWNTVKLQLRIFVIIKLNIILFSSKSLILKILYLLKTEFIPYKYIQFYLTDHFYEIELSLNLSDY